MTGGNRKSCPRAGRQGCNLGQTLRLEGRLQESLDAYWRGHELSRKKTVWKHDSAAWVREAEHLVELEKPLPQYLSGERQPETRAELAEVARLCSWKKLPESVRYYADLCAAQPSLSGAAGQAALVLAASPNPLADAERARLRRQALTWLEMNRKLLESYGARPEDDRLDREIVRKGLFTFRDGAACATVRDEDARARLPDDERAAWDGFWADVESMRVKLEAPGR